MPKLYRISIALLAGLTLFAADPQPSDPVDSRLVQIREFFRKHACPVEHLAEEFLAAADHHGLDWRLLPSLALVESGGGRASRANNIFGWGRVRFPSVADGIFTVARSLADGRNYRGKSLEQKLWTYNPMAGYITKVKNVMQQLGPHPSDQNSTARK